MCQAKDHIHGPGVTQSSTVNVTFFRTYLWPHCLVPGPQINFCNPASSAEERSRSHLHRAYQWCFNKSAWHVILWLRITLEILSSVNKLTNKFGRKEIWKFTSSQSLNDCRLYTIPLIAIYLSTSWIGSIISQMTIWKMLCICPGHHVCLDTCFSKQGTTISEKVKVGLLSSQTVQKKPVWPSGHVVWAQTLWTLWWWMSSLKWPRRRVR